MLFTALLCLLAPSAGRANGLNCGTPGPYDDGYYGNYGQGASEGAYGTITVRSSSQCNNAPSGEPANRSAASVLIGNGNGDRYAYVQSGFFHTYEGCDQYFAQASLKLGGSFQNHVGACYTFDGSTHSFNEQYGSGCGCEYAKIDGNVKITTPWNPFTYWTYPFDREFFGEAEYRESDLPGTSSAPTDFNSMQGQNGKDNNFYSFACNGFLRFTNQNETRWANDYTSCPSFEIYTK